MLYIIQEFIVIVFSMYLSSSYRLLNRGAQVSFILEPGSSGRHDVKILFNHDQPTIFLLFAFYPRIRMSHISITSLNISLSNWLCARHSTWLGHLS